MIFRSFATVVALAGGAVAQAPVVLQPDAALSVGRNRAEVTLPLDRPAPFRAAAAGGALQISVLGLDLAALDPAQLAAEGVQVTANADGSYGVLRFAFDRQISDLMAEQRVAEDGLSAVLRAEIALGRAIEAPPQEPTTPPADDRPLVMIDPGHGGRDPGAFVDGIREADLVLTFALELSEALRLSGRWRTGLTREADVFVPLAARVAAAEDVGADVFMSLHADTVTEGQARGITVFSLASRPTNAAAAEIAAAANSEELMGPGAPGATPDDVAIALVELAGAETLVRSRTLADRLAATLQPVSGVTRSRPHLRAGFRVLKAPTIPSVLIELGFMSSAEDLRNLQDPAWRTRAVQGILDGLDAWVIEDANLRGQMRR